MLKTDAQSTKGLWNQSPPVRTTTPVVTTKGTGFTPQTAYGKVDSGGLFERNQAVYEHRVATKNNVSPLVWTPDRARSHGRTATRFYGTAKYSFVKGHTTWVLNEHLAAMQGWADGTEAIRGLHPQGVEVNDVKQVLSEQNLLKRASRNKIG